MATQRPRDIPEGVLSQMGTMIVHRLVHPADREIVTKASSQIDRPFTEEPDRYSQTQPQKV